MKNIDISVVERYNNEIACGDAQKISENKNVLYVFLQGSIIHLEEDMKRFNKESQLNNYHHIESLYNKAIKLQEKLLKNEQLEPVIMEELNTYNTAKRKELAVIAVATIVLLMVTIIFSIATK